MTFHYDSVSASTTTTTATTATSQVNNNKMHTPSSSSSIARNDMPRHRESPTSMAMAGKSKFDDGQLMQRLEDSLGICDLEEASLASSKYTGTASSKKKQLELEYRGHGSAPVKTTTTTKKKKKKSTSSSSPASKTKKPLQSNVKKPYTTPSQSQQEENRRLYESLHDSLLEDLDDGDDEEDQEDREFQLALRSMRLKRLESTRRLSSAALDDKDSTHGGGSNRDRTKSDGSQESLSIWSLHSAPAATFRQGDAFSEETGYNATHARLMLHVHDTTASNSKLDDSDLSLSRFLHDIWHDETTTGTTNQEYSEDHEALYWYDLKHGQVLPPQDLKKRSVPPGYTQKDELYAKVQLQRLALASMSQSGHGTPQRKSLKRSNSNESVASMASKGGGWFGAAAKRGADEEFGNHSMHGLQLQDDQLLQMDSNDDMFSERGFAWACSSSSSINSTTMDSSSTHSITDGSRRRTLDRALSNKSERSITTRSRMPQKTSSKQSKSRRHLMKKDISTTSMLSMSMSNASKSRRQLMQEAKFNMKSNRSSMASSSATPLIAGNTATAAPTPTKQRRSFTKPALAVNTDHWGRFAPMASSLKYDQEDVEFLVFNDREFHKLQRALRKGTVVTNTYVSAILPSLMKQSQRKRLAYVQRQEQEDLLYQQQQQQQQSQQQNEHHYQSLPNMNGMNDDSSSHHVNLSNFNNSIGNMSEDLRGIRSTMSHRSSKPIPPTMTHVVTAPRRPSNSKSNQTSSNATKTRRGSSSKLVPPVAAVDTTSSSQSQTPSEARQSMAHHGMVPKRGGSSSSKAPPSTTTTSKHKHKTNKVETPTRTPIASNRTCKTKQQTPQLQAFAASLADLVKEEEKKMEADVEFDVEVEC